MPLWRKATSCLPSGLEGRSVVRVLPKAKASTASPGPGAFSVRKMTEGRVLSEMLGLFKCPSGGRQLLAFRQDSNLFILQCKLYSSKHAVKISNIFAGYVKGSTVDGGNTQKFKPVSNVNRRNFCN